MTHDADAGTLALAEARGLWEPAGVYLNTASYGLPPAPAWEALQRALAEWRQGRTSWEGWGEATNDARVAFARLVGVPAEWVATASTVSSLVGLVAASVGPGMRVLAPELEFTSSLWPFAVQDRAQLELVPLARLAESIDARTDVVVVSAVQSATGEVADLAAIATAAEACGALSVVDATHAVGWLPFDASRYDAVVCAAYKWLMSPRGTAFLTVRPSLLERIRPHAAGWFAAGDVHGGYYGLPVRLAASARRLDVSPAWFSWVGTAPALDLVLRLGIEQIHAHDLSLANRFRSGLGLEPSTSAIVSVDLPAAARLEGSNVRAAVRAGRLRTSWHVYNTPADVDAALDLLVG